MRALPLKFQRYSILVRGLVLIRGDMTTKLSATGSIDWHLWPSFNGSVGYQIAVLTTQTYSVGCMPVISSLTRTYFAKWTLHRTPGPLHDRMRYVRNMIPRSRAKWVVCAASAMMIGIVGFAY